MGVMAIEQSRSPAPAGYVELTAPSLPSGTRGMARVHAAAGVADAVREGGTLHDWAGTREERRPLQGRGTAWAVRLPDGQRVVVRHSRHGGLLAPLTGDRFLAPTRAPHELAAALRLAAAGVPTPGIVAYLTYPTGIPLLRRADVATTEIEDGSDLPAALARWPGERQHMLDAVATLIRRLTRAGAHHPDLNVKNILITLPGSPHHTGTHDTGPHDRGALAYVLDVDRVRFAVEGDRGVARANLDRLVRSVRRWGERRGALLDETELARIERMARPEGG